jgi:hypothetical protein
MTEQPVPASWVGRQVVASILQPQRDRRGTPGELTAKVQTGVLEEVNDWGIVASLSYGIEHEDPPLSTFHAWSAVLAMRLAEDQHS